MSNIALQLKESTRSAHNSAEGHHFQKALGSGTLPLELYKSYLAQLFLIHKQLEDAMESQPYMGSIITEEQFQRQYLADDLKALGVKTTEIKPNKSTAVMLESIKKTAANEPIALLGFHYVLLGSKHGGKFIASISKKSYGLTEHGATYFDPYGPEFQQHWKHFTTGINELEPPESELKAILAAASEMFECVENVGEEVMHAKQPAV